MTMSTKLELAPDVATHKHLQFVFTTRFRLNVDVWQRSLRLLDCRKNKQETIKFGQQKVKLSA
jgi:hypothetical protein